MCGWHVLADVGRAALIVFVVGLAFGPGANGVNAAPCLAPVAPCTSYSDPNYTDPLAPPPPRRRLLLSGARAVPSRFTAAHGTQLRFTLSATARVSITITEATTGKRCGTLIRHAHVGANSIALSGRFNGRALTPGRYRATFHAQAPHLATATPRVVWLTIVKG